MHASRQRLHRVAAPLLAALFLAGCAAVPPADDLAPPAEVESALRVLCNADDPASLAGLARLLDTLDQALTDTAQLLIGTVIGNLGLLGVSVDEMVLRDAALTALQRLLAAASPIDLPIVARDAAAALRTLEGALCH